MRAIDLGLPLAIVAFLLSPCAVSAQSCSASMTGLNWGTVNVLSGAAVATTASLTLNCSGTANKTVLFCVSISGADSGGCRQMHSGGNNLNFDFYSDSGYTQEIGSYWGGGCSGTGPYGATGWSISVPLGSGGSANNSYTLYALISAGQSTTASGSYAASFTGSNVAGNYAYNTAGTCASSIYSSGTLTRWAFNLNATVGVNCTVSAGPLNFGSTGTSIASSIASTATITAQCTNGAPYSIGLDNGQNASGAQRRMQLGATGHYVNYGLYTNSGHTLSWKTNTANSSCTSGASTCALGTGTGVGQTYTVYGQVPSQTAPAAGTFTDTVVMTVTF